MLILAIILLIVGGLIAYFGRPREELLFWAGVVIFAVGLILLIVWALDAADINTSTHDGAILAARYWGRLA